MDIFILWYLHNPYIMYYVTMINIKNILRTIGRKEIAKAVKVRMTAVSAASVSGYFPACWYPSVKKLAREKNIEVPDYLFNWRRPEDVAPPPKEESIT